MGSPRRATVTALLAVLVLLGLSMLARWRGEREEGAPPAPAEARELAAAPSGAAAARSRPALRPRAERSRPKPRTEPFWRALGEEGEQVLFVEVSAIAHSPAGQALLPCLGFGEDGPLRRRLAEVGLDLERDVDRLALTDGAVVLSGHFGDLAARLREAPGTERCGARGLCDPPLPNGPRVVLWGDELLIHTAGSDSLEALLGRLEGSPGESASPAAADQLGDLHLRMGADALAGLTGQLKELGDLVPEIRSATHRVDFDEETAWVVRLTPREPGRADAIVQRLRRTVADARGARSAQLAVIDRDFDEVLASVEVERVGAEVEVRLRLPASHLTKRFAGCRLGGEPPPEGYQRLPEAPMAGFGLTRPPGFVDPRENEQRLLSDWPDLATYSWIFDLADGNVGLEPRSLQAFFHRASYAAGICGRLSRFHELLAGEADTEVRPVTIGGRTWIRTTSFHADSPPSVEWSACEDDCWWNLGVTVPRPMPVRVAQLHYEDYLEGARLTCPSGPSSE